jgi:hypothetical protein
MLPEYGTDDFNKAIAEALKKNGKRHDFYKKTVEHHEAMEVHVEGDEPTRLLNINRPNEPGDVKKYRLQVYKPKTKSSSDKVINTVNKIFNPRLYHIDWHESPTQSIKEKDWIGKYMTEGIPFYESIMRWVRETYIRKDFCDPNAVCVVLPLSFEITDREYYKPVPYIYEAEDVLLFKDGEYYLIKYNDGKNAMYIDKNVVVFYKAKDKELFDVVAEYPHNIGEPPVFRLGGQIMGNKAPYWYHSFMSGVLPHWDDVVTLSSDLQAGIVNHLYLEKWEYTVDCDDCSGSGYTSIQESYLGVSADVNVLLPNGGEGAKIVCNSCQGSGHRVTRGPFNVTQINKDALNQEVVSPIPPSGYISKPIEIIDKIKELIKEEKEAGFAAINMEIINKVGADQSGIAKTIDRTDLDSFLMRISNHVFDYVLPNEIYYSMKWMYGAILTEDQILENFPTISKPKSFEVLDVNMLQMEMKTASEANVSSNILKHIEGEIVNTKYSGDEFQRKKNNAIIDLDPLYSKGPDELMTLLANGVIKKEDWILHEYIDLAIDTALSDNELFLDLKKKDQRALLNQWVIDNKMNDVLTIPVQ